MDMLVCINLLLNVVLTMLYFYSYCSAYLARIRAFLYTYTTYKIGRRIQWVSFFVSQLVRNCILKILCNAIICKICIYGIDQNNLHVDTKLPGIFYSRCLIHDLLQITKIIFLGIPEVGEKQCVEEEERRKKVKVNNGQLHLQLPHHRWRTQGAWTKILARSKYRQNKICCEKCIFVVKTQILPHFEYGSSPSTVGIFYQNVRQAGAELCQAQAKLN